MTNKVEREACPVRSHERKCEDESQTGWRKIEEDESRRSSKGTSATMFPMWKQESSKCEMSNEEQRYQMFRLPGVRTHPIEVQQPE